MSVKPITQNIESNTNAKKIGKEVSLHPVSYENSATVKSAQNVKDSVSFTGNPVVGLMDFIEAGGYAASFIIQDGIGFIAPRVGKGLLRGGKEKVDENGNIIRDENGNPKRELNWKFARKEFLREVITGPSAFLIPLGLLKAVKKYGGTANAVKLGYLDSFQEPYKTFANNNAVLLEAGNAASQKSEFYKGVLSDVIERSVNDYLPDGEKMSAEEVSKLADDFATRQVKIEEIKGNKTLNKASKAEKIKELGGSVEESFMRLKKNRIGGTVDELAVEMTSSLGKGKNNGSIGELLTALGNYFDDATKTTGKALKDSISPENIEKSIKEFTHHKMGTRLMTNLGLFGAVALFYTQIPKLYNLGLTSNPALNQENNTQVVRDSVESGNQKSNPAKAQVPFTGAGSWAGNVANKAYTNKVARYFSDMFELNGPVISGGAMATLLYGFCIPPRLMNAQDKYDFGEILLRDVTAFTALLFGAKAVARLSTDLFTNLTGLALNSKNLEGKNIFQKILAYVQPSDSGHSVLSSQQLASKYTNIEEYKGGVNGFVEFIEKSGGNIKKAFSKDKEVKAAVDAILEKHVGKDYAKASVAEIKEALKAAHAEDGKLIKDFYKLFKNENGMLKLAKTCNSAFGFASTILLIPGLIMYLTSACEKMTERRTKADRLKNQPVAVDDVQTRNVSTNTPTMAGFLGKSLKAS